MSEDTDLHHVGPVAADWEPLPKDQAVMAVSLMMSVPDYATVLRNEATGQIQFDNLQVADLVSLRDALTEQITQLAENTAWNPF